MKRFLSLSLSVIMIISVLLSSVSCDELLVGLLEEPIEDAIDDAKDKYSDKADEEYSKEEEKTTKKKNEKTTNEEYETVTERYTEKYPEYTYPSETDWITEWVSEWVTGHVCYDYDCDAYCDECGMRIGNTDVTVEHKCIDKYPRDHMCDTCGIWINDCRDKNLDHCCDICGVWMSECGVDYNNDHICDDCGEKFSECYDYDGDNSCDYCGVFCCNILSNKGVCSADEYIENGMLMGIADANIWINENRPNGISGVSSIGFRGWAVLGELYSDNNVPIVAFGYQIDNDDIIWNGDVMDGTDVNSALGTKEAKRYMITVDLTDLPAGDHSVSLYLQDVYGEIFLMDLWSNITVVVDDIYSPEIPEDHTCLDKKPRDHYCDECGVRMTECVDKKSNHTCYICGVWMSECEDNDMNHYCDVCGGKMSECYDYDGDKICDYCGMLSGTDIPAEHTCRDKDPRDHYCDECGVRMTECKEKIHNCYICGALMSYCADYDNDCYCDTCGAQLSAPEQPEVPNAPDDLVYITIADAIAIGSSFENKGEHTTEKYVITGVVTEVVNEIYGNLYITDGVDTIYIYGLRDATGEFRYGDLENPPKVGDTVTLLGVVGKYIDPQMKNAWMIDHIPA